MESVLLKIIPLDLASTLSPGILALTIVVLASKNHPKAHIIGLFFGILSVGIGISILGVMLGNNLDTDIKPTLLSAMVDFILGLLMILYGFKILYKKERKITLKQEEQQLKIFKWFGFGLIIAITNFDALILNFTAAKVVGDANIETLTKWGLVIMNLLFFTLPITLPILLRVAAPKFSKPILDNINFFMMKYGRIIVCLMFLIFGLFFVYQGIKFFC